MQIMNEQEYDTLILDSDLIVKDEVNGVDQYKVGDNVLVFLYKIKDEDRYGIRGSYNGKFYVGGDGESIYRYKACNSEENYEKFKSQTLKTELDSSLSELKNKENRERDNR